ncbi:hypothetical protein RUND412_009230 [Rhizina undulata]
MVQSDYDLLIEMGFDPKRATLAVHKTKGLQDALTWLEETQDKPIEELEGPAQPSTAVAGGTEETGDDAYDDDKPEIPGTAASLKCTDCGKLFSSPERAQYHATRTEHTNFEESTEIIQPLTEEQKAAKLIELRERLAAKKSAQTLIDREEQKKNEVRFLFLSSLKRYDVSTKELLPYSRLTILIRRKKGQEADKIKEELRKKEQLIQVEKRKREKAEDAAAKERVRQQIKETQEARKRQAECEKAAREGRAIAEPQAAPPQPTAPKVTTSHTETRLQLRVPGGQPLIKTFPADTTLFEVAGAIQSERGFTVNSFTMTFPRKVYQQGIDFGLTLKEAGMVPSCALNVA